MAMAKAATMMKTQSKLQVRSVFFFLTSSPSSVRSLVAVKLYLSISDPYPNFFNDDPDPGLLIPDEFN